MMPLRRFRRGSGYVLVITFAALLGLFLVILGRLRKGHHTLLSKSARDFLATTVAEAGLNCLLAELRVEPSYRTAWYFKERDNGKKEWTSPVAKRATNLGEALDLEVDGVAQGLYTGRTSLGDFKVRAAPVYGAKENPATLGLVEKEMYYYVEVVARVGDGKTDDGTSYRRIKALLERRSPITEHNLFDGEMLDLGAYGPFPTAPQQLRKGRYYGYQYILFNSLGGLDQGSELFEVEKIETPGMIRALKPTRIEFANKKTVTLNSTNDSANDKKFSTFDGFLLDGANGAHPIKFTRLPMETLYEKAKKPRKYGGFVIEKGTFPVSTYRNPYDPKTEYVDLNFGEYRVSLSTNENTSDSTDDENQPDDDAAPPYNGDDPGPLAKLRGKSLLIYSKMPLRIWGCPDRNVTIVCEGDIVIAGDFNQNPDASQEYTDDSYTIYRAQLKSKYGALPNGKDGYKVGALLMSRGRILIDVSRPSLFLANEMKPYLLYAFGMTLHPATPEIEKEMREALCPVDPTKRKDLVGLGPPGPDGVPVARYGTLAWLFNNPHTESGPGYDANLADLIDFFTPGSGPTPRFGIRDPAARTAIIDEIKQACRMDGILTVKELDRIYAMAWAQAVKEENEKPEAGCGPMALVPGLFAEAKKSPTDGIFLPEITINAALVSSTRRAAPFRVGLAGPKTLDEIGNAPGGESMGIYQYLKEPAFIIQRVYGSEIRLGTAEPTYFITGKYTGANTFLRRRVWDPRLLVNADFKPPEIPLVHNLLTYSEETISKSDFDKF
ncbi:MAG: hypothetical protein OZSIB_2779 [Candidatus Ozemobacter sibiricus]|jgi:hypothetical protein|uniref:Uncharacterized protein n=1 Tax=Candidatus Ozemobacter sibiricus TaxID=2268124 RepID=A0A367ZU80_9BACT|nr:MAG: hypothetical protein OZSIB_2779 [Candidatus Ozemobacter sibiricus]